MAASSKPPKAEEPGRALVIVVDDDRDLRDALANLFQSVGMEVSLFGSASELMRVQLPDVPSCLVLDIRLPGISGLEFQGQLAKLEMHPQIVFMTGHGDIPMSVRAMKAGAVDFLAKPFRDQDMLDAVAVAIERDRERRTAHRSAGLLRERYAALTSRECEVMKLVTAGLLNKQIAGKLELAEITVKIHRGNMMRKMKAGSVPELVRIAESLGLHDE